MKQATTNDPTTNLARANLSLHEAQGLLKSILDNPTTRAVVENDPSLADAWIARATTAVLEGNA